jgi:hypothetical protein
MSNIPWILTRPGSDRLLAAKEPANPGWMAGRACVSLAIIMNIIGFKPVAELSHIFLAGLSLQLWVKEIDYFADVMEDITKKDKLV